jgi:hypothetical protein
MSKVRGRQRGRKRSTERVRRSRSKSSRRNERNKEFSEELIACLSGKLLLVFASTVILSWKSCGTHDHILLSSLATEFN